MIKYENIHSLFMKATEQHNRFVKAFHELDVVVHGKGVKRLKEYGRR